MRGPWWGVTPFVPLPNTAGIPPTGVHELLSVDLYPLQGGPSW